MKIIVTGGAGFIGSEVIRYFIRETDCRVCNLDKLTYAGNLSSLAAVGESDRYCLERADICDGPRVERIFSEFQPDAILHLAAESHVDRSIDNPSLFIQTNVVGTHALLEAARKYWRGLAGEKKKRFRFHHISTDEVYGSLGPGGLFTEETPYRPNSPYSASKASSDHLVRAWGHTYGLPVLITNCSNNYGPCQFPEKLIPLMIIKCLEGKPLPIYGKGENIRDWLHVEDHVRALHAVLLRGRVGETYNIGGNSEKTNLEVVRRVCAVMDRLAPNAAIGTYSSLISFVEDRPGHDLRYAIDAGKIERELGWRPLETFESGLEKTVAWYLKNQEWWRSILEKKYQGERIGLAKN